MVLTEKVEKADKVTDTAGGSVPFRRRKFRILLPNNSLFSLCLTGNRYLLHGIHREKELGTGAAIQGERISITFRWVKTWRRHRIGSEDPGPPFLVGQGAIRDFGEQVQIDANTSFNPGGRNTICLLNQNTNQKSPDNFVQKREVVNEEGASKGPNLAPLLDKEECIKAFSAENQQAGSFDWEKEYGLGFEWIMGAE